MSDDNCDNIIIPDEGVDYLTLCLPDNKSRALEVITALFIAQLDPDVYHDPRKLADDLISITKHEFRLHNQNTEKNNKWPLPQMLEPAQVADLMLFNHHIKNISCAGAVADQEYDLLAVYQEFGEDEGIYLANEMKIKQLIRRYYYTIKTKDMDEVISVLKEKAERTERCSDRDLIAVNNGIFDYKNKILLPFDPDHVFLAKSRVDYNPGAVSPVIFNNKDNTYWEIEGWIKELFEDGSDVPETIWQIIGAVIRPYVSWGKAAWFVATNGNNGKGTICSLMRNLAGKDSHASIPLADFGKDFILEQIIPATSIIVDENDVGTYIDKAANLKAVITGDVLCINRKFKRPIPFKWMGFVVECLNELPKIRDRSDSFFRRQLFIKFDKSFTGQERKYIKDDYLKRKDVLEYVLYRVLHMDYYEITEPESCRAALEEYKIYNDPVREFLDEALPRFSWDCVPSCILYEMYKGWSKINNPNGTIQRQRSFSMDVKNLIDNSDCGWYYASEPANIGAHMNSEEPLLDEYNCTAWMMNCDSKNRDLRINTKFDRPRSRGIFRCDTNKPVTA